MVEMDDISEVVHVVENVLDDIRAGRLSFNTLYSDLFLLSMDHVRNAFEATFNGDSDAGLALEQIKQAIKLVVADSPSLDSDLKNALRALDPGYAVDDEKPMPDQLDSDMEFFHHLSVFVEDRIFYKKGSAERTLTLALAMNDCSDRRIDPDQLRAAVYLHDFGMAMYPVSLLHKDGEFSPEERQTIEQHPVLASHLLAHLPHCAPAMEMVRQHHERVDGQGYPDGLVGDAICDGAKILAIADTFESMTNYRPDREHKRPLLRAITEINGKSGSQFDPLWVKAFNQAVRSK